MAFNLLNFKPTQQPPKGLLGPYYDPAEERRQKIFGAMSAAGAALLGNGQGNFGQVLGQGLAGANQGAQQAGQNYRNDAMLYSQMEQQQQDRLYNRGIQGTKMGWELEDRAKADAKAAEAEKLKKNQVEVTMDWLHNKTKGMTPEEARAFESRAAAYPDEIAKLMVSEMDPSAGKPTDDISEYNFAKSQGFTGTFQDYMIEMKKAGAQNITVGGGKYGTIPPGYELVETPQGAQLRVIPGGPAAAEEKAAEDVAATRSSKQATLTDTIVNAAATARKLSSGLTTGIPGQLMKNLGPSDSAEIYRQTEVLKSNAKIENLNAMRRESKTGGALGAVTQNETEMLAAAAGALDPSAGSERYKAALDNYERTLLQIVHGYEEGTRIFEQTREKPDSAVIKKKYGLE